MKSLFWAVCIVFVMSCVGYAGQTMVINNHTHRLDVVGDSSSSPTNSNLTLSSTLGSETVAGGGFGNFSSWSGAGWSASGGVGVHSSGTTALTQATPTTLTIGTVYKFTVDFVMAGTGGLTPSAGGMVGTQLTATQSGFVWYFTANATTALALTPTTGFTGSVDNVSLKAVSNGVLTVGDYITGATSGKSLRFKKTLSLATSSETAYKFEYTVNKAGGDDYGVVIDQTDTASPGTSWIFDVRSNNTSKFRVDNVGATVTTSLNRGVNATLLLGSSSHTVANVSVSLGSGTHSNSSGTLVATKINPTYNQSGTGAATDLQILRTETALGTGAQKFCDFGTATTTMWGMTNLGIPQVNIPAAAVASGDSITPTAGVFHVSGTTTVNTIAVPYASASFTITIIPDGVFSTGLTGNIANVVTTTANVPIIGYYDANTSKWYFR